MSSSSQPSARLGWSCFALALVLSTWPLVLAPDAKLLGKDVIKEIAVRWKALDEEEQEAWKEQAKLAAAE